MSNTNDGNEQAPNLPPGLKMTLNEVVNKIQESMAKQFEGDADDGSKSLDAEDALTKFDPNALVTMDDKNVHKVASGRIYRRVAERDGSRLMMAANLESIGKKNNTGGYFRTAAVIVRFIALDGDKFPELKTRDNLPEDYPKKEAVYKDKIAYPFCLDGGPLYVGIKWNERNITQFIVDDLSKRVPQAEVPAILQILDALHSQLEMEDPIKPEVVV